MLGLSMKSYYTTITTKHWNEINGHGAFELGSARCLRAAPFQSQHADTTRAGVQAPALRRASLSITVVTGTTMRRATACWRPTSCLSSLISWDGRSDGEHRL